MALYGKSAKSDAGQNYLSEYEVLDEVNLVQSILSNEYNEAHINHFITETDKILEAPYSHESALKIFQLFGRRSEKLKLYKNELVGQSLRHLYGSLKIAQLFINDGYKLHLFESVCVEGIKKMGDIDLLLSKNGEMLLIDYTQRKGKTNLNVLDDESKINILENKFLDVEFSSKVCSYELPKRFYNFTMKKESDLIGNFANEFEIAENLIHLMHEMTDKDCKLLLDDYSTKAIRHTKEGSEKLIKTLTKGPKSMLLSTEEFKNMISSNSVQSANSFDKMRESLGYGEKGWKSYSLDWLDEIEDIEESPIFNFPLASRSPSNTNNDPFMRMIGIMENLVRDNELVHPLIHLICLSKDGELHPTEEEIKVLKLNPLYENYEGITVQRDKLRGKDELMNSVKISFNGYYKSLKALAFGDETTKDKVRTMKFKKKAHNYSGLENLLNMECKVYQKPSYSSRHFTDIDLLIDSTMEDCDVSNTVRQAMRSVLHSLGRTWLGSMISQTQETAAAVCNTPRKKRIGPKDHAGFKAHYAHVSLDCVSDRFAVMLTNMSSTLNSNKDQTVCMAGNFSEDQSNLSRKYFQGLSEWSNYSAADLDWHLTILHKLISWLSLEAESHLVNDVIITNEQIVTMCHFPSLIMMVNDGKFAQASEMVRYIFVNSTGISGGTQNLYDKIRWYKPSTMVEKLYMCRMIKMSTGIQWFKANNIKTELLASYKSDLTDGIHEMRTFQFKHWKISFPHEMNHVASDLHTYNSFYICKAFTVERHNKNLAESLVVLKQIEARRSYMKIRDENRNHELRFLPMFETKTELIDYMLMHDYSKCKNEAYSPNPLVVMLGGMATLLRTHKTFNSIKDVVEEYYDTRDLPRSLKVTDILNNRGSLSSMGKHGVITCNKQKAEVLTKKGGKVISKKFFNQNEKCYSTVLQDLSDTIEGKTPPQIPEDWNTVLPEREGQKPALNSSKLKNVLRSSNRIWPIVSKHVHYLSQFVSKMTHKAQIGNREIATLNAASRICCFYVEEFSRLVRDTEHKNGMNADLIERSNKEHIVKSAFRQSRIHHNEGKTVVYDSADCSKWGPSMLCPIMYISLGLRISDEHVRGSVQRCLSLFSNKVFKIPDSLYTDIDVNSEALEVTNAVREATFEIKNMTWPLGKKELQIINLPESMHQGILGVTSSVLGTDLLNLSKYVTEKAFEGKLVVEPYLTSDDYTRILYFQNLTQDDDESLTSAIKKSLSLHCFISDAFGIKRNMEKSTHSTVVMEFNSVFYTPSSENKPDIKSRLSYVDLGHSFDPYPNSLSCLIKGAEFLRNEGSLVGACWIQLLNTHLSMLQNQNIPLFRKLGKMIFQVPLELGGYAKIDPVASIISSKYLPIINNYTLDMKFDPETSFKVMMDLKPDEVGTVSLDPEDEMKSLVPKMSRSGMIHLCRRDKRESRKVREYIMTVPRDVYIDMRFPSSKSSMLPALLACMQREESSDNTESATVRFSVPQTPMDAKLFRTNSKLLRHMLGDGMFSRKDVHNAAVSFAAMKASDSSDETVWKKDLTNCDIPFFYQNFINDYNNYLYTLKTIRPLKLKAVNKRPHEHPLIDVFVPSAWYELTVQKFARDHKPVELGGNSNIDPLIYLESVMMYQAKLRDLISRKQSINLNLLECDNEIKTLIEKICLSSFMTGARMVYDSPPREQGHQMVEDNVWGMMKLLSTEGWDNQWGLMGSMEIDILDPTISALITSNKLKYLNVTTLLNASVGTSETLTFNDSRSKLEVWHSIKQGVGNFQNSPLVVSVGDIRLNKRNEKFTLGTGSTIYSIPMISHSERVFGRETIMERRGVYHHYFVILEDEEFEMPKNTLTDKYYVKDLSMERRVRVVIKNVAGFLLLTTTDGYNIQVLCSSLPDKKNKVYIHFSKTLLTKALVSQFQLLDPNTGVSESLKKILTSKMSIYNRSSNSLMTYPEEKAVNEEVDMPDELLFYEDSDDDFLFDADEFNQLENDNSDNDDALSEKSEASEDPFASDSEEDDNNVIAWDDEIEDRMERPSALSQAGSFISQYGVFQPTSTLLQTMAYGMIEPCPGHVRRNLEKSVRNERTICLTLPFDTGEKEYASGPTGTGLTELMSEILSLTTADSTWFISYIRDCLVNDKSVITEARRYVMIGDDLDDF